VKQELAIEHARRQEAELVRKKAANDFHDELGHRLTKIGLFTEIVKRKLRDASPDIMKYLDKISDDSQNLTSDTRDFIWTLDPDKDSLFDVAIHLKDFGEELFDRTGIAFTTKGISEDLLDAKLSMETRRHLTLIFKEGMNNILKHAAASNVTLAVELQNANLRLVLSDDGKGYTNISSAGYGLKNMQQRADKIHSAIRFESEPGRGSTIELTVKTS
jgi:signal transduction histidine kinase